jgi:serine/threonine protein kinase
MKFVHLRGLIRRDVEPRNILFDENYRIGICNFGLVRALDIDVALTCSVETLFYKEPELSSEGKYCEKIDISLFCIVLYDVIVSD